jgi:hypothetical protein
MVTCILVYKNYVKYELSLADGCSDHFAFEISKSPIIVLNTEGKE